VTYHTFVVCCFISQFFHHCEKYLKETVKGGMIYFGLHFQRFQSIVGWLHYFGPEARQKGGSIWKRRLITS
jgi:hypothetical protein